MFYFVSGHTRDQIINSNGSPFVGPVVEKLRALELYDLFGDINSVDSISVADITTAGPSGAAGVLLSHGGVGIKPVAARFFPERQAWRQVSAAVWIGTEPDPVSGCVDPSPEPEQLERETCVVNGCENVVLEDGNIWEIPVLREPVRDDQILLLDQQPTTLPSVFYRNVEGVWVMDVIPRYRSLWNQSRHWLSVFVEGDQYRYIDMMEFAAAVIGLRYRFNLLVHSRWPDRFLTTENATKVIRAAIGWNIIERHMDAQKKTQPIEV